jgi:hypothetical protein
VRILGVILSLTASLVLAPFGTAHADEVVVGVKGTATTHDTGYPNTAEPWRSMTRASFVGDGVRHEWTVSPRRVVGTFAVAVYGCTGSIQFAAQRQG